VPRERIARVWAGRGGNRTLGRAVATFRAGLQPFADEAPSSEKGPPEAPRAYDTVLGDTAKNGTAEGGVAAGDRAKSDA
jgi:hypothetical protein